MRNNSKLAIMMVAFAIVALFGVMFVEAEPTAPTDLTVQSSSSRDLSGLATQSASAQGGNVTQVNIDALTITSSWQGYYGDISGEITLDDGSSNTFYNWSVVTVEGEVYATRNDTVTWAEVVCANTTHIAQEETYLGQTSADGDSVSNTFGPANHPAFDTSSVTITADSCNSTNAFASGAEQSTDWVQVLLHQNDTNAANIIYSTLINDTTTGFDGSNYDFQLLVGENEKSGSEGVTAYYFWVELN